MSARGRIADEASLDAARYRQEYHPCPHVARCGCFGTWRVYGFQVADALLGAGWTLTPPDRGDSL